MCTALELHGGRRISRKQAWTTVLHCGIVEASPREKDEMSTTTTAPETRYRKTKAGTWVAFGPAAAITAGAEITVTTRSGEVKTEHIERIGRPFTIDGVEMVYGYLTDRPAAHGGVCENCDAGMASLTECEDSSGISGYCCSRCASAPAVELSFC